MSPFDPGSVLLAKHAQHVVLIHFPIALFIAGVGFDLASHLTRNAAVAKAAFYNLVVAAISTLPVVLTGLLAWHFALEGAPLKGILRWHLLAGIVSTILMTLVARLHWRAQRAHSLPAWRLPLELFTVGAISLTAHLGGFLSGVNT